VRGIVILAGKKRIIENDTTDTAVTTKKILHEKACAQDPVEAGLPGRDHPEYHRGQVEACAAEWSV
jgi:hypothetical protein